MGVCGWTRIRPCVGLETSLSDGKTDIVDIYMNLMRNNLVGLKIESLVPWRLLRQSEFGGILTCEKKFFVVLGKQAYRAKYIRV